MRRTAVRALGFARFGPAVRRLVELLVDRSAVVRSAVVRSAGEEALVYLGEASRGHLRHTLAGARPDRRGASQRVIDQLDRAERRSDTDS